MDEATRAIRLVTSLFNGDTSGAAALLDRDARLDAPRAYPVEGTRGIVEVAHAWPTHYPFELASLDAVAVHLTADSSTVELRAGLVGDGPRIELPIALVTSPVGDSPSVRLYHSERLLSGERKRRRPVFPVSDDAQPTPTREVHPVLREYLEAIASGDAGRVLERLADGAVLSNGVRPVGDREELRRIYDMMARTGGTRLVRGREFDTGQAVIFEYTGLAQPGTSGGLRTPPGGGVAIYRYDARHRITGIQVFDDFDPDALLAAWQQDRR